MVQSTSSLEDYRIIFDISLMVILIFLLLLTIALFFFKQKNVPVSQCVEVDPREPHSITITFVPSAYVLNTTNDLRNSNTITNPVAASADAPDASVITQNSLSSHNNQTASIA